MFSHTQHRTARITAVAVIGLLAIGVLAGCGAAEAKPNASSAPPTDLATPTVTPTAASPAPSIQAPAATTSAAPSAAPDTPAAAVTTTCSTLVSAQTMYNFNPNFTLVPGFTPEAGSGGGTAIANKGIACGWVNNTSRDTLVISAARPGTAGLASAKTKASTGTAVAGFGDSAYYTTVSGAGRMDVFSGSTWVTATSAYFSGPTDAAQLITSALAALK